MSSRARCRFRLFVPGLHDRLPRDFSAFELDGGRTKNPGSPGIGAGLRERELVPVGDDVVDMMSHGATANIVPERRDRRTATDFTRLGGRVVAIDDLNQRVV